MNLEKLCIHHQKILVLLNVYYLLNFIGDLETKKKEFI